MIWMKNLLSSYARIPFVRNILTMQCGRMISIGCSFVSSIIYARVLGLSGYGLYAVVMAFAGTAGLITNLGQQATALTFFAEAHGAKDRATMAVVLKYYVLLSIGTIALLGLLAYIAPHISLLIYGDVTVGQLAVLVFLSSMMEPVFAFTAIALQVVRRITLLTVLENTKIVLQLLLAVLFLLLGYGVRGVLLSSLGASAVFCIIGVLLYPVLARQHSLPSLSDALRANNPTKLWRYIKDGFWIAIDKNIGNLYPTVFLFAMSTVATESVVGLVRLAVKLAGLPASFVLASVSRLSSSVIPEIAGRGKQVLRRHVTRLALHAGALHLGATIGAAAIVPLCIPLIYGEHFGIAMYPFWVVVALNLLLALHAIVTPILRVYSKIAIAAVLNVIATLLGMGVFVLLARHYSPTIALYGSMTLYHIVIALVIVPAWRSLYSSATSA